jgi:hypothetical protein
MEVDSSGSIPVQAVLKLIIDRGGTQEIENQLKNQDTAFSKVEQTVTRIGSGMEGVARTVAELAGVAGVGALVDKFIKVETSASNIALAMGKTTGGSGTYHGVGQEMLGVQSRTGVSVSESESALRALAQSIGLSPKAGQAGMLAEVIAGYSKVTGMPASTLGSILGPMLQAEGRTTSSSAAAYTLGEARANLTAFPGSQIEGMLPVVSNLATSAAAGTAGGSGKGVSVGGIAALINTMSGSGVLRQPGVAEQAAQGIGGTLQGAYKNPRVYAFMKMAGIGFQESQLGFNNPVTMEKIVREANRQYPGNTETDWKMRRLLYLELGQGEFGADALEKFEAKTKSGGIHVGTPQMKKEAAERANAQGLTTPEAFLSKLQGKVLGDASANPLDTVLAGGGAYLGLRALGAGSVEAGASTLAAGGGLAYGAAQLLSKMGKGWEELGIPGASKVLGAPALGFHELLKNPSTALTRSLHGWESLLGIGGGAPSLKTSLEREGGAFAPSSSIELAKAAMQTAEKSYGPGWWHDDAGGEKANQTIRSLLEGKSPFLGPGGVKLSESSGGKRGGEALSMVDKAIKEQREYGSLGPQGYWTNKFGEAVEKFAKATDKSSSGNASYTGGGAMHNAAYAGAPVAQAMLSAMPATVMAAFLSKGGSTTPMSAGAGTQLASYSGPASGGWNSVLEKYSGNSYGLSHVEQLAGEQSGGGAHAGDRATVEADAKKYGIPFNVLWGVYGAESSFGKAKSNFGLTGQYPGTGTSGNFGTDARMSAEDLANLAKQMHINVNVNVGGSRVEQHKAKIGGQLV